MDETDRGKVVRFFLAGSVLCLSATLEVLSLLVS